VFPCGFNLFVLNLGLDAAAVFATMWDSADPPGPAWHADRPAEGNVMSLDRSLKRRNALVRHRNVLSRTERIEKLTYEEKFDAEEDSVFGLPKVAHRKVVTKSKPAKAEAGEEASEGAEAPEGEAAEEKSEE
jgi:small basic protein (TIGR04137 family)